MNVISVETKRGRKYTVGNNCTKIEDHVLFYQVHTKGKVIRIHDPVEAELDLTNPAICDTMIAED